MRLVASRMTPWAGLLALCVSGCASAPREPLQAVDLSPARLALASAEGPPNPQPAAAACLERARQHLQQAEGLASAPTATERERAAGLARLAQAEAGCATALAAAGEAARASAAGAASGSRASGEAEARAHQAEAERRRLEERVALLQRHLDATETELIRSKARLKGVETRAEASAAIAEARVLMRRALDARGRTDALGLCQISLDKAEDAMEKGNFGMAVFYAVQARDRAAELVQPPAEAPRDRPAAKAHYVVAVQSANLRAEPFTTAPVVAQLKKGQPVEARALRGEWVQVQAGGQAGWVLRSLLE